jgi:hypothetical protein
MISSDRLLARSTLAGLLAFSLSLDCATHAAAGIINFDAVDTSNPPLTFGVAPDSYLAGFGVTVSNVTPTTTVGVKTPILFDTNVVLLSNPNYLSQWWAGINGTSFDLIFDQPLVNLSVSIPQITSGVIVPAFSFTALDASGTPLVTSFSAGLGGASPRRTFVFDDTTNPGLQGLRVFSNVQGIAGMGGIPIDDLVFTRQATVPEPSTFACLGAIALFAGVRNRRRQKALTAPTAESV